MDVTVVGAGPGGALLAAGARRLGVDVRVLERGVGPGARRLGYRVNLDATGCAALRGCLDAGAWSALSAVLHHQTDPVVTVRTAAGRLLSRRTLPVAGTAVDRTALQRVLVGAAGDAVRWGVEVAGVEPGCAQVRCADGSVVDADVVVGADGGRSAVRRSVLPDAAARSAGSTAVYGRVPVPDAGRGELVREALRSRVTTLADTASGDTVVLGAWNPGPGAHDVDLAPYVMWVLITAGPVPPDGGPGVRAWVADRVAGWTPEVRDLVAAADAGETFGVPVVEPAVVPPWPAGRVTLLGDAAHPMSPAGGRGANLALADAAHLVPVLDAARRDPARRVSLLSRHDRDVRRRAAAVLATPVPAAPAQEVPA